MTLIKYAAVVVAALVLCAGAQAAVFEDNFDSYATGSDMHGQGGWKGWDNSPAAGAFVSSAQAVSSPNSVDITGPSDLVHEWSGLTSGRYEVSAQQYIPSGTTGTTYFLLLNTYNDGGPYNWSVQIPFNMDTGMVTDDFAAGPALPVLTDQWVPLRADINLDADTVDFYYNDMFLSTHAWRTDGSSATEIRAVDLFANGPPSGGNFVGSVYYDNFTIDQYAAPPITWNSADGDWNTAANWNPQQVPNLNGQDNALIDNGATVSYPSDQLGDLTFGGDKTLTISGGSTWTQVGSPNTHWTRINNGTLAVDGGTFERTATGNVVLPFDSDSNAHMSLSNGAVFDIGGELWFGHTGATTNQTATVDIDGSTLTTGQAIWFWDTDAAGNQFSMNFTGTDTATVTTDWLGRRDSVHGAQNNVLWESMWSEGLLLVNGQGAADGLKFTDFFTTTGNPGPFNGTYTLAFRTPAAAPIRWNAGDGDWNTAASWDPQQVPNLNGQDSAVIDNGAAVTYPSDVLGDLTLNGSRSLTISGGSTWTQVGSPNTHWTRINTGTLSVDGGTFERPGGGNVVMPFDSDRSATLNLTNGAVFDIGGELWLGHNATDRINQVAVVNVDGSTLTTAAAIWFWDTDAAGNDFSFNFTGADKATVTTDWLGRRDAANGQQNDVLWETLWDEGLLLVDGQGAADGLLFADFFLTSGDPGPFNGPYTLEFQGTAAVPEPSTLVLAALGLFGLVAVARRRR